MFGPCLFGEERFLGEFSVKVGIRVGLEISKDIFSPLSISFGVFNVEMANVACGGIDVLQTYDRWFWDTLPWTVMVFEPCHGERFIRRLVNRIVRMIMKTFGRIRGNRYWIPLIVYPLTDDEWICSESDNVDRGMMNLTWGWREGSMAVKVNLWSHAYLI